MVIKNKRLWFKSPPLTCFMVKIEKPMNFKSFKGGLDFYSFIEEASFFSKDEADEIIYYYEVKILEEDME